MHPIRTRAELSRRRMEDGREAARPADTSYLLLLAISASLSAFFYYANHGQLLLQGDATAHINIARRVFDSRTPGLSQLGTVWLPLLHILLLPFVAADSMWQSGMGGAIPSMVAYVAGTLGVFRLVRRALPDSGTARVTAWLAAATYATNPNLLYLQTTAMTEPLYLALFIWATVFFAEYAAPRVGAEARGANPWHHQRGADLNDRGRALRWCAVMLGLAMLTRYDGWFAAAVFAIAALALWIADSAANSIWQSPLRGAVIRFLLILAVAPALWFVYNAYYWNNPLEFATGPYSARAIEQRSTTTGSPPHPGWHAPATAAAYYLKSAKLNLAGGVPQHEGKGDWPAPKLRLENFWIPLVLAGVALLFAFQRRLWPWLLLWIPLPFYVLSIAWGDVPIFLPVWWPYSHYNVRYGLQLLPAFAVFGALVWYVVAMRVQRRAPVTAATAVLVLFIAGSYWVVWKAMPICLREPLINSAHRIAFERQLASQLRRLPDGSSLLVYSAYHAAALEFAGFPLRRTINESSYKLWQQALADPAKAAEFVLAFDTPDDPVNRAVHDHPDSLESLVVVQGTGEPKATLYRRK